MLNRFVNNESYSLSRKDAADVSIMASKSSNLVTMSVVCGDDGDDSGDDDDDDNALDVSVGTGMAMDGEEIFPPGCMITFNVSRASLATSKFC